MLNIDFFGYCLELSFLLMIPFIKLSFKPDKSSYYLTNVVTFIYISFIIFNLIYRFLLFKLDIVFKSIKSSFQISLSEFESTSFITLLLCNDNSNN
jgi:hypothetical protein